MFPPSTKKLFNSNNDFLSTDKSFQQEFLKAHNIYREKYNAPQMTLSNELTASAQKWADHLLSSGALQHSNTEDGENIYNMSSSAAIKLTGGF